MIKFYYLLYALVPVAWIGAIITNWVYEVRINKKKLEQMDLIIEKIKSNTHRCIYEK